MAVHTIAPGHPDSRDEKSFEIHYGTSGGTRTAVQRIAVDTERLSPIRQTAAAGATLSERPKAREKSAESPEVAPHSMMSQAVCSSVA